MSAAAPALLHHRGVSGRATLPVHHGDCRVPPGACFMGTSPILGPMRVRGGGVFQGKGKPYQDKDDCENIDEFDSDVMFSKNGPPISLASNSRPQATSAPGEREKEIVELFKTVQAQQNCELGGKAEPEPAKAQGERGSVVSLLKLLRKHSVDQRRKSSDDKEQNLKFQPVISADRDADANRKSIANNIADAVQSAKTALDERTATDEPADTVSPYEPDSVIEPENISLDDLAGVLDDDESVMATNQTRSIWNHLWKLQMLKTHGNSATATESSDLSSLKVAGLRELAKSRGIKVYSKMKKSDPIEVLSSSSVAR
ncbi:hypothetical protein BS78_04G313600 [Paspalum vaginatum]|nr:hypothetical protein BS78_04G313600 [Paspalum vaginatum]